MVQLSYKLCIEDYQNIVWFKPMIDMIIYILKFLPFLSNNYRVWQSLICVF
jgi:hypothetical protein